MIPNRITLTTSRHQSPAFSYHVLLMDQSAVILLDMLLEAETEQFELIAIINFLFVIYFL